MQTPGEPRVRVCFRVEELTLAAVLHTPATPGEPSVGWVCCRALWLMIGHWHRGAGAARQAAPATLGV
jgi:hypothetical protein